MKRREQANAARLDAGKRKWVGPKSVEGASSAIVPKYPRGHLPPHIFTMPVRKRNEFLDDPDSDGDDAQQSDESGHVITSRVELASRNSKRRRKDDASDSDDLSDAYDDGREARQHVQEEEDELLSQQDLGHEDEDDTTTFDAPPTKLSIATHKSHERAEKATRKSGVIYISRVPPFMKPQTLRSLLAPYAMKGLGRIFLTPEEHSSYQSRKKSGGNKKRSFTDGWIEFASKTEAKTAADMLNGNIIGGKKGGYYHDDLWNIKYLSGFKWSHLTDQIAAENAEREARMREEIRRTRKENKAFMEDYERGKMLETMRRKEAAKGMTEVDDQKTSSKSKSRKFEQVKARQSTDRDKTVDDAAVRRTLGMIF